MPNFFCPSNKRLKDHCAHCSVAAISFSISLHAPSSSPLYRCGRGKQFAGSTVDRRRKSGWFPNISSLIKAAAPKGILRDYHGGSFRTSPSLAGKEPVWTCFCWLKMWWLGKVFDHAFEKYFWRFLAVIRGDRSTCDLCHLSIDSTIRFRLTLWFRYRSR